MVSASGISSERLGGLGHSHPHEVGGAQRRARRLFSTVSDFVFVFSLGGPTPSEAAGGRPLTQRSKTLGPVKRLFYQMKDKVRNKLSKRQHEDEASWSTRPVACQSR